MPLKYLALGCWVALVTIGQARDFFVAPGGRDTNRGTGSEPLATLQQALALARTQPPGSSNRIVLGEGEYFGVAIELGPADSGLTICAAPGEKPVLYGGQLLSQFKAESKQFVAADLSGQPNALLDIRMLLVNGRLAPRARYPEKGCLTHLSEFKVPWMGTYRGGWQRKPTLPELTTMKIKPGDVGRNFEPANAELTIYHVWDESVVGVKSYNPATGEMRFASETGHPPGAFGRQTYVIWNTREGMTRPGQWYADRVRHKIAYWPLPGENFKELRAMIPTTTALIRLNGTTNQPIRNVVIQGVTMAVANTPLRAGGFGAYVYEGMITGEHLRDCSFSGNTLRQGAGQGIKLSDAVGCRITQNEIHELGAGGILCDGKNVEVSRNQIHNVGRIYPSGIGLTCSGSNHHLWGNFIHDTPYVGLTSDGVAAVIESNRLERVMEELHDGAGIYMGGMNHLIRFNYCRDIGRTGDSRHAYYLDELVRDTRLEYNLAVRCPSPLHNHIASNNVVLNNLFINDGDLRLAFYRCEGHRLERNLLVAKGQIEVFRPEAVTVWSNNLFYSGTGTVTERAVPQYSPGPPSPLRKDGVQLGPDPKLMELGEGFVYWATDSAPARLGIQPVDLRACGQNAGPRFASFQLAQSFDWARETLPDWLAPYTGKAGLPRSWRKQHGSIGAATAETPGVVGIDFWQANHFIVYREETAEFLYGGYTLPLVKYRAGSLPSFETLAARYPAKSARERALALLTKALPAALRHPSMPPCGRPVPPARGLLDEELLQSGAGYCNEQARVFVRLCQVSGIPARLVFIFYADHPRGHVAAEFYADGRWSMADTSWFCVFPDKSGRLLSAAELHSSRPGRQRAEAIYRARFEELLRYKDEQLSPINGAGARRTILAQLKKPEQLEVFGIINYPLPGE